jgi:MFS transporter, OCT family, solute carrier family 22 (organic cation transporter), member 4/5
VEVQWSDNLLFSCLIPECETQETARFDTNWLSHALPGEYQLDGSYKVDHCKRFKPVANFSSMYADACPVKMFTDQIISCDQLVFDKSSLTIVEKWNITCEDNEWKLPFVGTAHFLGVIVGSIWMAFGD